MSSALTVAAIRRQGGVLAIMIELCSKKRMIVAIVILTR